MSTKTKPAITVHFWRLVRYLTSGVGNLVGFGSGKNKGGAA